VVIIGIEEYLRNFAKPLPIVEEIRRKAKAKGLDRLTMREIKREIKRAASASRRMLRVALDTNVVVSGLLCQKGAPAAILDAATSKQIRCYVSESLLEEYREVLTRDYPGLDQRRAARFIGDLREVAIFVVPPKKNGSAGSR